VERCAIKWIDARRNSWASNASFCTGCSHRARRHIPLETSTCAHVTGNCHYLVVLKDMWCSQCLCLNIDATCGPSWCDCTHVTMSVMDGSVTGMPERSVVCLRVTTKCVSVSEGVVRQRTGKRRRNVYPWIETPAILFRLVSMKYYWWACKWSGWQRLANRQGVPLEWRGLGQIVRTNFTGLG